MKALRRLLLVVAAAVLPLASLAQEAAKPPPVSFYGILHTAAFFNGGTMAAQDAAYQGSQTASTGGSFYMSARQSRVGMKLNLGDDNLLGAAVTGVLEFDFMGANAATSNAGSFNPGVRLRHAALTAGWKTSAGDLSLLVGQEWDIVLNVNPDSVAYMANPMFGQSGNLFRRVPQVRLSWFTAAGDLSAGAQLAVMNPSDTNSTSLDNGLGNQSRSPNFAARASVSMKGEFSGTIGAGYETQKRRFNAGTATQKDVTTSLIGIDVEANATKYLSVKGELFMDKGQSDALTGFAPNTTIRTANADGAVEATGYWAQAVVKPVPEFFVTLGLGKVTVDKLPGAATFGNGDRTENSSMSVGLIANVSKSWRLGLDYYMTKSTYGDATKQNVDVQQIALGSMLRF